MNDFFIFFKTLLKAYEKFEKEKPKNGDSWKTVPIDNLRMYLLDHIDKWNRNIGKEKEITDLIDLIDYCVMIIERLKSEKK